MTQYPGPNDTAATWPPVEEKYIDNEIAGMYSGFVENAGSGYPGPDEVHRVAEVALLVAIGFYAIRRHDRYRDSRLADSAERMRGIGQTVHRACGQFYRMEHPDGPVFFAIIDQMSQEAFENPPYRASMPASPDASNRVEPKQNFPPSDGSWYDVNPHEIGRAIREADNE